MAPGSHRIWLIDIRAEIRDIRAATTGMDLKDFSTSWVTKRAVEHALLIIAEAAKHLPGAMKDEHPEIQGNAAPSARPARPWACST